MLYPGKDPCSVFRLDLILFSIGELKLVGD